MLLSFDDELGARHFEFVFVGFILGGSLQQTKGIQVLRTELALLDKLESVSDPKPCGKKLATGEPDRILKNGAAPKQIPISVPEYDLLFSYIAKVPWQSGAPVRHAVETLDWLTRAERGTA